MTHVGYIVGGYAVTAVALAAYVARLRWRSRALSRAATTTATATTADPRR